MSRHGHSATLSRQNTLPAAIVFDPSPVTYSKQLIFTRRTPMNLPPPAVLSLRHMGYKLVLLSSALLLMLICVSSGLSGQRLSAPTLPLGTPHGRGGFAANHKDSTKPLVTLQWRSNYHSTLDTALVAPSAVYNQQTNTMVVFGGRRHQVCRGARFCRAITAERQDGSIESCLCLVELSFRPRGCYRRPFPL